MNVTVINTIKAVITYLESKAVGDAALVNNIFTGPNEERTNKAKKFITLLYEMNPLMDELGDGTAKWEIDFTIIMGYRIDVTDITGTEKEIGDTFFETFTRYLRSYEFKEYMAVRGIKVPPVQMTRGWRDMFSKEFEGIMRYNLSMKLWTYINALEDIP